MKINPVYVIMLLGLFILVPMVRQLQQQPTSFYGIAENQDLDLSIEYATRLKSVLVQEGQTIAVDQPLALLERVLLPYEKAQLEEERSRLQADRRLRQTELLTERERLEQAKGQALFAIDNRIAQLRAELAQNAVLLESLPSVQAETTEEAPVSPQLQALLAEREITAEPYQTRLAGLRQRSAIALDGVDARLRQVELELKEVDRQAAELTLQAPEAGVIGRINFVPGEQIAPREAILNLYQPHPSQVTTYIPEGQAVDLNLGDTLSISSLQNPEYELMGEVIGLGNKIRELPVRMRRDPTVQAWGREVLLRIQANNALMQGERVLVAITN